MVTEEIQFDPDVHPSYVGRLVKVRESLDDPFWRHGVCCFAMTEWTMEDYHGDGKLVKVEKITGGYQLQWGLFERVEQAREQKRKQQKVRDAPPTPPPLVVAAPIQIARDPRSPDARPPLPSQFSREDEPFYVDELIASGLMMFTDLDHDHGTLDLDKCGDEIPSAWRQRAAAEERKKAERAAKEAAAKKAKAAREAKERQRLAAKREAEAKRRADAAAAKARRSSGAAAAASAKRRRGDAGASMLMAAVDFVEAARADDIHSDDESRLPKKKRGRSNPNAAKSSSAAREISEEEEAAAAVESLGGGTPSPPRDREDSVEGGGVGGGAAATAAIAATARIDDTMAPPAARTPAVVPPRKTSLSSTAVHVLGSIARRVGESFGGGGGTPASGSQHPAPPPDVATAAPPSNVDEDEDSGATTTEEVAPTAVTAAAARYPEAEAEDDPPRVAVVAAVAGAGRAAPAGVTASQRVKYPEASEVFRGGSSTTWMIRLLASWMSPTDAATRDRHVAALAALEEKKYDFAERLVLDAESDDAWSWRLLEYCDVARGRINAAGVKAERAVAADAKAREEERSRERVEDSAMDGGETTRERRSSPPRSGSLPFPGRGPGTAGAMGAVFKLIMDVAGEPGDWSSVWTRARDLAARHPTDALLLMLHGGASWRRGDLAGSVAPLRAAMHHDDNEARAAPWLFEVLLRLDLKDDAEWVWDKALETNREMSRKLMRIAQRVDPRPAR
jgi:hypothetical protein